jgi:hypothetical protein
MDLYSIQFTLNEIAFVRQSLDVVTVKGTDAKFLANLQTKLEEELLEIQKIENEKLQKLQEIESPKTKNTVLKDK